MLRMEELAAGFMGTLYVITVIFLQIYCKISLFKCKKTKTKP